MSVSTASSFDVLPPVAAAAEIAPCCASTAWQRAMVAGRPYGSLDAVLAASDTALAGLTWNDVLEALAAHPRIGQRATGDDTESRWSRAEQSAAATSDASEASLLVARNVAYGERFGWVFLICATGKPPSAVLAAVTSRLANDVATEQAEVREQLRQIVRLRLAKVFGA